MRVSIVALATLLQLASAATQSESEHPLRKRTQQSLHKSQQRRVKADEGYDIFLGLVPDLRSINVEQIRQRRTQESCTFCPTGLAVDPAFEIPGSGVSCGLISGTVQFLTGGTEDCMNAQMAQQVCCPADVVDPTAVVTSVEDSMSMPMMPTVCSFCPDGLANPDFVLPTDDEATCAQAAGFAASLNPEDATCTTVQLAEAFCCPPTPATLPATTAAPPAATLPELVDGECSCSPLVYNFELAFDQNCDTDDLTGTPGIGQTFCFLGATSAGGLRRLRHNPSLRQLKKEEEETEFIKEDTEVRFVSLDEDPMYPEKVDFPARQLQESLEIISVQFLEFDSTGNLIVINQDDTYSDTSLMDGDVVTFKSIANDLDPEVPVADQLDLLPGGVQVTMRGRIFDPVSSETKIVSNRITWSYTNACDAVPIEGGENIGWTTITDVTPASEAFCPALRPVATTEAPMTTTEATTVGTTTAATEPPMSMSMSMPDVPPPSTTEAPPATTEAPPATTEAPPATTEAPPATTEAPPATTEAPPATEVPPTDSPPMFAKSGKGGKGSKSSKSSSKAKKKTVSPKTNKTPKNPMAKVHKASSKDDGHQDDASSSADTKSGKAKVDLDTKAEKAASSKAEKESSNDGKAGKLSKTSSKGAKVSSAKSDKSSKAHKATKLFKETPLHDSSTTADMPPIREEGSMSM